MWNKSEWRSEYEYNEKGLLIAIKEYRGKLLKHSWTYNYTMW